MSQILSAGQGNSTPKSYLDLSRPKAMAEADNVFDKLLGNMNANTSDIVTLASKIALIIQKTPPSQIDKLWHSLETVLNKGRPLTTKSQTNQEKLQTAFGMFYTALDEIDTHAKNSADFVALRKVYQQTRNYLQSNHIPQAQGMDQRLLIKEVKTLDKRFTDVMNRFNTRLQNGEMVGKTILAV